MRRKIKFSGIFLLAFLLCISMVFISEVYADSGSYMLTKSVLDMGGAPSSSVNFQLIDAIGQPATIGNASSENCQGAFGFFSEPEFTPPEVAEIYPTGVSPQIVGEEFWVEVVVGSNENPVSNLFGVSFELAFSHTEYIDVVTPETDNIVPGDFLGADLVFYAEVDEAGGKLSAGISRKTGQGGVDGTGVILRVKFVTQATTPHETNIIFTVQNVIATDPDGNEIALSPGSLTITIISGLIVWPGDTNNDGIVNQVDILPLGLYWSSTGPARAEASMAWTGQICTPWTPENATYADANGDGTVNQVDVLPIGLNWNKTHTLAAIPDAIFRSDKRGRGLKKPLSPTLRVNLVGEVAPNNTCSFEVVAENVADLFGLSFELVCLPMTFVDSLWVEEGSWLGSDIVFYPVVDLANGKVSIGMSRKAGQGGVSGSGTVATIMARFKDCEPVHTEICLQNVVANDSQGNSIQFEIVNYTITTSVSTNSVSEVPKSYALLQNYPNPFNPETTIEFAIPEQAQVRLEIYDIQGRMIKLLVDELKFVGKYVALWDGRDSSGNRVASGVYFYKLTAIKSTDRTPAFTQTRKMILMK